MEGSGIRTDMGIGFGCEIHSDEGNKFTNMFTQVWSGPAQENYMHIVQFYRVIGDGEVWNQKFVLYLETFKLLFKFLLYLFAKSHSGTLGNIGK